MQNLGALLALALAGNYTNLADSGYPTEIDPATGKQPLSRRSMSNRQLLLLEKARRRAERRKENP